MDEDSKKVLYKQLVEMYENNNNKDEQPIIAENEYLQLLAKDALAYILNYRENADFGLDDNGQKNIFYIELPDMDLSGEDLSHLRIKEFIPGTFDEYGMLTASYIDLQDTNALVDLNDIGYTRSEENETGVTDYIIDFELMNFNGCDIYGILPDEYAEYEDDLKSKLKSKIITQNKEGHLDERYIQRRKEEHLSKEEKARSDKAYKRIMSGNSIKGMRGVNDGTINLNDYDFSELNDEQVEALGLSINGYSVETNDVEVLEKIFKYLDDSSKGNIMEDLLQLNKMDLVEELFNYLDDFHQEIIVEKMSNSGKIRYELELEKFEFLENLFAYLDYYDKNDIVERALQLNKMDFVEKHFKYLNSDSKEIILIQKIEQNDIEYVENHFEYLYGHEITKIVEKALELGKTAFAEKHFYYLWYESKEAILVMKIEQNDTKYVEEQFEYLDRHEKIRIVKKAMELNKMDFVEKHFYYFNRDSKKDIVEKALELDKVEFVENHFKELNHETQEVFLYKIKNPQKYTKLINNLVNDEKSEKEFIGKKEQLCSGKILYKALSQERINEELIYELIKAGSNVNYINYENNKNYSYNQVIYTPILMKTLEITDVEQKNRIIRALIEAGVNVNAEKLELNYYRNGEKTTKHQKATDDKDLQKILNEKSQEKKENEISSFLKQEMNLSEEEIAKLEELYQSYEKSIYEESYEALKIKKEILSAVNCEREGFTDCARILFLKPEVIYSRLKFFTENGIIIEAERLQETLGSKAFAKRFGKKVLPTQTIDLNDTQYPAELKRELLQRYPMPRKKEELKVELDKVSEKYKGRESD